MLSHIISKLNLLLTHCLYHAGKFSKAVNKNITTTRIVFMIRTMAKFVNKRGIFRDA